MVAYILYDADEKSSEVDCNAWELAIIRKVHLVQLGRKEIDFIFAKFEEKIMSGNKRWFNI